MRGLLGPHWIFMVDFGIYNHIPLQKSESHVRSLLRQGVPGWLANVLQINFWWFSFFLKPKLDHHSPWKVEIHSWPILDKGKRFEVICTKDLEMVTWKPILIEAIKVFITSLNQLWAELIRMPRVFSRPGRSQVCSTNTSIIQSFSHSVMVCENIFTAQPRTNGWRWCFQSENRLVLQFCKEILNLKGHPKRITGS